MSPKKIKVEKKSDLVITWDDETSTKISLKYLRDECPCAGCKGETILLRTYRPPKLTTATPEMYLISSIDTVGDYAVQISWKDGHNTGIYSWEYLKQLEKSQDENEKQNYQPLI